MSVRGVLREILQEKCTGILESSRRTELKKRTEEILDKSCGCETLLDTFSVTITAFLQVQIKQTCDRVQAVRTKRTKLWGLFHLLRTDKKGVLVTKWNQLLCNLKIEVFNPICMQLVYEKLFENLMKEELDKGCTSRATATELVVPSVDELNALRYAALFVPHSLLKRFEKRRGEKFSKFITCLGEMAVVGEGGDILLYTSKWLDQVNRGGLFPLNDNSFSLFVAIEKVVKTVLHKHILSGNPDKESFKHNVHDVIIASDETQFYWCVLSQDIDDEQSQELLREIIKLWVTIRGFSMATSWMETYKQHQKKTIQKSTSLRKSISGSC